MWMAQLNKEREDRGKVVSGEAGGIVVSKPNMFIE